jgi:rhamnogalacturonan endolyase
MRVRSFPMLGPAIVTGALLLGAAPLEAQYVMERLERGVVAVRASAIQVYVGWRLFGNDPAGIGFNVYRTSGGSTVLLTGTPITATTNYVDTGANLGQTNAYFVRPVVNGVEQAASAAFTLPANAPTRQYLEVPLQLPAGGTVNGSSYTYSVGDVSIGDLDGDGEYEYVLKWDPSNQKDNSQEGYTGPVLLDAYRLNGTRLWRIDLGRNIRAGAHYTQFQVYDYDGDGRAEVAVKTADGTVSGTGQVIGSGSADHRNSVGRILTGPEFLTVFSGLTGAVMASASFQPARGTVSAWGDNYGNRSDRFLAGTAYLDGQRPSIIMGRGYYNLSKVAAWDFRNGSLSLRWMFDSASAGTSWEGRGAHSLSVADVDGNRTQEVIYGGMTLNANGTGRYTTSYYAHGDALHVGDFVPTRPGLEIWMIHEQSSGNAASLRDANNGALVMTKTNTCNCEGPARGVAGDVYAGNAGGEFWGSGTGLTNLFNSAGGSVGRTPGSSNFLVWWDADPVRELLDGNHVDKYGTGSDSRLLTADGASSINGTKATPTLSGDVLGDWREEVILRSNDSRFLRIYTTIIPATSRFYTFLHDAQYRVALAWQNTAYNQPPHPSFFVGQGMSAPPTPNITFPGGGPAPGTPTYQAESAVIGGGAVSESTNGGFTGSGYVNFPANGGFLEFRNVDGGSGGTRTLRLRFALGVTASRTGRILVNGAAQNITFNPTGAWTSWVTVDLSRTLNAGTVNVVRLESTGADLANIDRLEVP